MSDALWYIRLRHEVLGPISEAELRDLAERGAVQSDTPISRDRTTWTTLASMHGIAIPPPPPPLIPPGRSQTVAGSGLTPGWLFAGIGLGGLGVLLCGGLLLFVIAAFSTQPVTEDSIFPVSNREDLIGQRTLAYWQALGAAFADDPFRTSMTSQETVTKIRQMAAQIRALPTSEVDSDAIQCGIDVATVLEGLADFVEQNNSSTVFVEAFLRGLAGDPFGKTAEILDAQSVLQQQLQQVQTELDNARAVLSSRYGVEFPPI